MSIKQRLEYGIFPIASRRHQPREPWGSFQRYPHDLTKSEALTIIALWVSVPVVAFIGTLFTYHSFWETFIFMFFVTIWITWQIKHG